SLAWTTMIVKYSKHAPLRAAITQTFDGAHPCSLCHAVNAGKNSEKKTDLQSTTPKIDMICSVRTIRLISAFAPLAYAPVRFSFVVHSYQRRRIHEPSLRSLRLLHAATGSNASDGIDSVAFVVGRMVCGGQRTIHPFSQPFK